MSIKIKGNPLMCPTDTAAIQAAVDTANGAASTAATAQSTAQAAQARADGKVSKSGDTMTGNLDVPTINGLELPASGKVLSADYPDIVTHMAIKDISRSYNNADGAGYAYRSLNFYDKNDVQLGRIYFGGSANGTNVIVQAKAPNGAWGSTLEIGNDTNGTPYVKLNGSVVPANGTLAMTDIVKYQRITVSDFTLAAGGTVVVSSSYTAPSGYSVMEVTPWVGSTTDVRNNFSATLMNVTSSSFQFVVHNFKSSSVTGNISFLLMFVKTAYLASV